MGGQTLAALGPVTVLLHQSLRCCNGCRCTYGDLKKSPYDGTAAIWVCRRSLDHFTRFRSAHMQSLKLPSSHNHHTSRSPFWSQLSLAISLINIHQHSSTFINIHQHQCVVQLRALPENQRFFFPSAEKVVFRIAGPLLPAKPVPATHAPHTRTPPRRLESSRRPETVRLMGIRNS